MEFIELVRKAQKYYVENKKVYQLTEEDFLVLAKSFKISEKVHRTLIEKFRNHLPQWEQLIEKSFLESEKKVEFKELIHRKLSRFA